MPEQALYRRRHQDLVDDLDRAADTTTPTPGACLVQTFTQTTYPTAAAAYYACHPVTLGGAETEGGAGTTAVDTTTTVMVWNSGGSVPPTGTMAIVESTTGRLVMQYG